MSDSQAAICHVEGIEIGPGRPLAIVAGPCVLESQETNHAIASTMAAICRDHNLPYIFKASYDKANRSSIRSARGPGLDDGLAMLARIRSDLGAPITTDVHEPSQAAVVGEVVDLLQVPAFLCRQTDLLVACGETGRAVNVKKGQFLSPSEMRHVVNKLREAGCNDLMLTERGTFFGYHRLVNDFIGLGDMIAMGHPVCFDVTHSTQLPGAETDVTGGRPDRADLLARAAVAAGVHALFIETHPEPEKALSDRSTVQPLDRMPELIAQVAAVSRAMSGRPAPA